MISLYEDHLYIVSAFILIIVFPYLFFYKIAPKRFEKRFINPEGLTPAKTSSIIRTLISLVIGLLIYTFLIYYSPFSQVLDTENRSLGIMIGVIVLGVILNDSYFFWVHYALHEVKFLRKYHHIHHLDSNPTPLSAFNFHVVEGALNFLYYPIVVSIIPMSKMELYVIYLYMLVNNSLGHLPIEFCPRWFYQFKASSLLNAATHHILHHKNGKSNYALYYLFWDKKMNTLSSKYYERFNKVKDKLS